MAVDISYFILLTLEGGGRCRLLGHPGGSQHILLLTPYFLLWKEADVAVYSAIREAVNISYSLHLTLEGGGHCRLLGHPGGS